MARFNNQKAHYDSLISLFKYLITLSIAILTLIAGVITWLTWSNGKEMREDLNKEKVEIKKELQDLKNEVKENENKVIKNLNKLTERVNGDIDETRKDALNEISNIKDAASVLAEQEARRKINDVFENKNFDDFVVKIAQERIEPRVRTIVDETMASLSKVETQNAIDNLTSNDISKEELGWSYFSTNIAIKLNNTQQNQLVRAYESKNTKVNPKSYFAIILQRTKSDIATKFFKEVLSTETYSKQNTNVAISYFIAHNIEHEFLEQYIIKQMEESNSPQDIYYMFVFSSTWLSENYTAYLLNNRNLVRKIYNNLDKD
ncbi:hypothetical protein, partial [Flavobacterium sp. HTF]|uniref:hypothetical protein n=1 Tax=Flavobacterium sp. HTF TaxID=2170732 RepID=UPI000D5C4D33